MFRPKVKKIKPQVEEEYEEEYEEEHEGEQEVPPIKQKANKQISKQEIADMIEGNLNRSLQLVQYLRA